MILRSEKEEGEHKGGKQAGEPSAKEASPAWSRERCVSRALLSRKSLVLKALVEHFYRAHSSLKRFC